MLHILLAAGLLSFPVFPSVPALAAPQAGSAPGLLVTPSTATVGTGQSVSFSGIDTAGRPVSDAQWSIDVPVAELHTENGEVLVTGMQPGRGLLTVTADGQTASATIAVVSESQINPGTVNWSLDPMPGYETLRVAIAYGEPAFYTVEWSSSANAIVRALDDSGQQLWMRRLSSTARPEPATRPIPPPGEVYMNGERVSDHSLFILGEGEREFVENHPSDPSYYGLPPDGKTVLINTVSDSSGGLIVVERGRFNDWMADLSRGDGTELWRYRSPGRLVSNLTVNQNGDIGVVETTSSPLGSGLLIVNEQTGQAYFRVPFPISSSTADGFRCKDPRRNVLKSVRPSRSGSVLTSVDEKIYVQVETNVESTRLDDCKSSEYTFDDTLSLLSVNPSGEAEWKIFEHNHADSDGKFMAQPRMFPGETIPAGPEGVLAAWTFVSPQLDNGKAIHVESRLSRLLSGSQQDFTLPLIYWTKGIDSPFYENMVLGEKNVLYATNGKLLVQFDAVSGGGVVDWGRAGETGTIKLQYATAGGGVLVTNGGLLFEFDTKGNGARMLWNPAIGKGDDIGLARADPVDGSALPPIGLRELKPSFQGFLGIEEGAPSGRGALLAIR